MIDFLLQTAIVEAIQRNSVLRFEMDRNKVVYIQPKSAYNLNSNLVELRGSAEIIYLGGKSPNRFISRRELRKICLWVDENFKVVKMLCGEEIPHRIEEDLSTPEEFFSDKISKKPFGRDFLKDKLETPPFLKNKIL